jgi:hypothetical protein
MLILDLFPPITHPCVERELPYPSITMQFLSSAQCQQMSRAIGESNSGRITSTTIPPTAINLINYDFSDPAMYRFPLDENICTIPSAIPEFFFRTDIRGGNDPHLAVRHGITIRFKEREWRLIAIDVTGGQYGTTLQLYYESHQDPLPVLLQISALGVIQLEEGALYSNVIEEENS